MSEGTFCPRCHWAVHEGPCFSHGSSVLYRPEAVKVIVEGSPNTKTAVMTIGGTFFDPANPRAVDVNPVSIDHALGRIVRFNGHTRRPITVSEHCLRVRRITKRLGGSRLEQLLALLHDAAEAYIGDVIRPIKSMEIRIMEDKVLAVILEAVSGLYGIGPLSLELESWKRVRLADEIALFLEAMIEQPGAEVWAPDLIGKEHPEIGDMWTFLPDYAPRDESWIAELHKLAISEAV